MRKRLAGSTNSRNTSWPRPAPVSRLRLPRHSRCCWRSSFVNTWRKNWRRRPSNDITSRQNTSIRICWRWRSRILRPSISIGYGTGFSRMAATRVGIRLSVRCRRRASEASRALCRAHSTAPSNGDWSGSTRCRTASPRSRRSTRNGAVAKGADAAHRFRDRACMPADVSGTVGCHGARGGEVLALRWSDIDGSDVLIARSLTQTRQGLEFKGTKTDRPRRVGLPGSVLASLAVHQQEQGELRHQFGSDYRADLNLIFANPDGTPLRPDSISASVSLLCRRLGLPRGASLHTLRHSHGSVLLADGVDLATVSERLGHSSVRVTADIYSHALRGRDQDAAKRWDEFMRRNGGSRDEEVKTRAN